MHKKVNSQHLAAIVFIFVKVFWPAQIFLDYSISQQNN